jgi:hypothetical protein
MACNTNRCALRRFDGHGSGSYRPSNSGLAKENENNLAAMIAARNRLDSDLGLSIQKEKPEIKIQNSGNLILAKPDASKSLFYDSESNPEITTWKTPSASNWQKK